MKSVHWIFSLIFLSGVSYADTITHGSTTVNMDFANIRHMGNDADSTGYGAVGYNYRIGVFEVTSSQWEAVKAADSRIGSAWVHFDGSKPATDTSWHEAAKFANWLTTGDAYSGAYQFNSSGLLTGIMTRSQMLSDGGTFYLLPTENEWYKAAYLKSDGSGYTAYSTGDGPPVKGVDALYGYTSGGENVWSVGSGSIENNGTFDMGGNAREWLENSYDGSAITLPEGSGDPRGMTGRAVRGGSVLTGGGDLGSGARGGGIPTQSNHLDLAFRVVAIPEPSSVMLLVFAGGVLGFMRRRMRR